MEDPAIGWIAATIIGGFAGWLAEMITRSNMGLIANIVLGVIGAGLATWLLNMMGIKIGGPVWLSYLVSGFIGACVLIIATRILAPGRWRS
jgi:uncharacterized membrane protein YeaQ/YmgE (transglycosylase-associated protein family)